jgi:glycosyltransferase involved in cell wall biosynthesis
MRIAMIVPGGVDRSATHRVMPALLWLIERLAVRHTVHVVALAQYDAPCSYSLLGATVHNIGRVGPMRRTSRVIRCLRDLGPFDVLHAFWATPSGLLAAAASRILHTSSVVSLWGGEHTALPAIGYGSQLRARSRMQTALALRLATKVTAPSRHRVALAERHGVAVEEVALGVPKHYFEDIQPTPGRSWRLLHVASLNRVKDQSMLLHAMRHIADAEPGAHLDIVGEDTLDGELQRLATSLNLDGHVAFHGFKTAEQTRIFFRQAHAFLLSSQSEAGPLVVLEAAAHGVPTIGTRVGHVADLSPSAAVAVPVGDADALAAATIDLLTHNARRHAIGQAARSWAKAHDADWTAQAFEAIYMEVIRR